MHKLGQSRCAMAEFVAQPPVSLGFFDWIQILPLDIFDERDFERFGIVEIADNCRYL